MIMFKQAVETSKIFWLLIKQFGINYENADTLHNSCIEEVKLYGKAYESIKAIVNSVFELAIAF